MNAIIEYRVAMWDELKLIITQKASASEHQKFLFEDDYVVLDLRAENQIGMSKLMLIGKVFSAMPNCYLTCYPNGYPNCYQSCYQNCYPSCYSGLTCGSLTILSSECKVLADPHRYIPFPPWVRISVARARVTTTMAP